MALPLNPWRNCDVQLCLRVCQRFGHKASWGEACPRCLCVVGDEGEVAQVNAIVSRHILPTLIDDFFRDDPLLKLLRRRR